MDDSKITSLVGYLSSTDKKSREAILKEVRDLITMEIGKRLNAVWSENTTENQIALYHCVDDGKKDILINIHII